MSIKTLLKYWRAIFIVAEMTIRQQLMDMFILFGVVFQPIIIAVLALWMLMDKGEEYAIFVVVGSGLTGLWTSLLFVSGGSINQERWSGTLESLVAAPIPFEVIIFGKNLANVIQSLISMVTGYLTASLLFGYSLTIEQPLFFVISLFFTIIAFISFGLVIAPVFVMNPNVRQWQNAMEYPVYILCGFLFPVALLAEWARPISYILPPYWAARALHGTSSTGTTMNELYLAWGMMLLFSVIDLFIASRLFKVMLYKARADATLALE